MSGLKVTALMVIIVAGIITVISAIIALLPYVLMTIGVIAIARMLVRQSDRSQP